jgi:hypothetical protein
MNTVYSTKTPIIHSSKQYTFNYACKRESYVDACYCVYVLNKAAKDATPDIRFLLYKLKHRWIEKLYREGYCVQAEQGERLVWHLVFLVDDIRFQWHIPGQVITWDMKENRAAVFYEWQDGLPLRTRPIEEAIALLGWVLS